MKSKNLHGLFTIIVLLVFVWVSVLAIVKAEESRQQKKTEANREQTEKALFNNLISSGLKPTRVWIEDETVHISLCASGDNSLGAEDIMALKLSRNVARIMAAEQEQPLKGITSINNVLVNSLGTVLYDVSVSDFLIIPEEFTESVRLFGEVPDLSIDETAVVLDDSIKKLGLPLMIQEIVINPLGGYSIKMTVNEADSQRDISVINQTVQDTVCIIHELNGRGCSISEFYISIPDPDSAKPIYQFTADLIYSDYLWWQDPGLGYDSWTGSTPMLPE